MRVLVVGDLHVPSVRHGYLQFCKDLYRDNKCDTVVFIGDIVDLHAVSYWDKHPDADGPTVEIQKAKQGVSLWSKAFPKAIVTVGNHDRLIIRKAATGGVPELVLKSFSEIWDTPRWKWVKSTIIDDVLYLHGDGCGGGNYPAYNTMRKMAQSCVLGHHHTASGVKFLCNRERRLFGMDVGCGVAWSEVQFLYQDNNPCKPIMSAGTVIDGIPQVHIMPVSKGEKYHDSRFKK